MMPVSCQAYPVGLVCAGAGFFNFIYENDCVKFDCKVQHFRHNNLAGPFATTNTSLGKTVRLLCRYGMV